MSLHDIAIFSAGFLVGGLVVRVLVLRAARRFLRPHLMDEHYTAARHAAVKHLAVHGTLNLAQMSRLMDAPEQTVRQYLEQMEHDGFIAPQEHRGGGRFYTRR